jgi:diguanylate cyclase (GGDEF)-like protein
VANDGSTTDPRTSLPAAIAAVVGASDLDAALEAILGAADASIAPAMGAVVLADPDRAGLQLAAAHGLDDAGRITLAAEMTDPTHPFGQATTSRTATFDRQAESPTGDDFVGAYLPLLVSTGGVEVAVGAIGFGWRAPHELSDADREALAALAGLATLAVDRARLASTAAERSEWFERMAHNDPLTGLANERTVGRILELELARAGRQGGEVSLAMFDVDDFQATNRDGGFAAGDDVLRRVASVLAESVRLVDTVGRIGGDEFVLIAPGSAGLTVAKRVLDGIAALPAVAGQTVSVSAGVATFPADGTDSETLIAAVTAALDRARSGGGGSVAVTESVAEG